MMLSKYRHGGAWFRAFP